MNEESPLKNKVVLVVDDEPDVLEVVEEELDMCIVHKAGDYETGIQYLLSYTYDVVVLDIMGVRGFDLLKESVSRGFPTVMLTAHALSPEALKKSIKLGAVSFLPKDEISSLKPFLEDIARGATRSQMWRHFFERLGAHFNRRFGVDWKERDRFFAEFEKEVRETEKEG